MRGSKRRIQFLQDENGAGDRRVERGRKAGARAGRQKHPAVGPVAAEHFPDQVGHGRPHLNARALTTQRKPRPDRQHPADELDRDDAKRRLRQFPVQHRLDVRDAAPRRIGREAPNQGGRDESRSRTSGDDDRQAFKLLAVRPGYQERRAGGPPARARAGRPPRQIPPPRPRSAPREQAREDCRSRRRRRPGHSACCSLACRYEAPRSKMAAIKAGAATRVPSFRAIGGRRSRFNLKSAIDPTSIWRLDCTAKGSQSRRRSGQSPY